MRRWAALALVMCVAGCTNAPVAAFLDLVHPIHVGQEGRGPDPFTNDPAAPLAPTPTPAGPPPPPAGQLLAPTPLAPTTPAPPFNPGPSGSGFTPSTIPNNGPGAGPLSIPNP